MQYNKDKNEFNQRTYIAGIIKKIIMKKNDDTK